MQIFIYIDSDSSIQIATNKFFLTSKSALDNDSDIKTEVRKIFKQCSNFINLTFVRAHQDDDKPFKSLSTASKLNVLMDQYAKNALEPNSKPTIRNKQMIPHLPAQQISLYSQFHRLTRHTLSNLHRYKIGHKAEKFIQHKRAFSQNQMNSILWHDFNRVLQEASITKRTQFLKSYHGLWPTMQK